jgi:hypothetical protein
MLERKFFYERNLRSIFISKFCFKNNKSIFKKPIINFNLIIKRKEKNKVLFLFIMCLLITGSLPDILKTKKITKRVKQDEFLAFKYTIDFFETFKFLNLYLPLADIVEVLYFRFNRHEYKLTIKHFPVINELNKTCESNTVLLDYIQDYKLILNFKTFIPNWYLNESIIRSMGLPLISNNRF